MDSSIRGLIQHISSPRALLSRSRNTAETCIQAGLARGCHVESGDDPGTRVACHRVQQVGGVCDEDAAAASLEEFAGRQHLRTHAAGGKVTILQVLADLGHGDRFKRFGLRRSIAQLYV